MLDSPALSQPSIHVHSKKSQREVGREDASTDPTTTLQAGGRQGRGMEGKEKKAHSLRNTQLAFLSYGTKCSVGCRSQQKAVQSTILEHKPGPA